MGIFGAILICALIIANLVNLPWTFWLVVEQLETGWGYGTNMEMMALLPWALEFLCVPVIIAALIYVILCFVPRIKSRYLRAEQPDNRKVFIINISILVLLILQILITNLFIWN